jgi:20S proteasome subunit alpha 6
MASKVAKKYRAKTYVSGRRPFGVGILLAGFDDSKKPRIFELTPGGDSVEYEAWSIGAKSQSSKTYLENNQGKFHDSNDETLILHGLASIKAGYRDEKEEMGPRNIEVSLVNEFGFKTFSEKEIGELLGKLGDFNPKREMQIE